MWDWLLILLSYVLGSLSSAIIVCHIMGLPDPRKQGSNNPGATNVLRFGGKKAAAITLFGDVLKGLLPVLLVNLIFSDDRLTALVGIAAFMGHLFPMFFDFRGGKGVATALGVLTGFSLWVGVFTLLSWLVIAKVSRISSLSALIASFLSPFYVLLITGVSEYIIVAALMTALLFYRHRQNIKRLLQGEEGRIGS